MPIVGRVGRGGVFVFLLVLSSCGQQQGATFSSGKSQVIKKIEELQIATAVENLASGAVSAAISADISAQGSEQQSETEHSQVTGRGNNQGYDQGYKKKRTSVNTLSDEAVDEQEARLDEVLSSLNEDAVNEADPCPAVSVPSNEAAEEVWSDALKAFGTCLRELMSDYEAWDTALDYFMIYDDLSVVWNFSDESGAANLPSGLIEKVGMAFAPAVRIAELGLPTFRSAYSDSELVELMAIASKAEQALVSAEARAFLAVAAKRPLLERFSSVNRYGALLKLTDTAGDQNGRATALALAEVVDLGFMALLMMDELPIELLHPYALLAIYPNEGNETEPLDPMAEDPFSAITYARGRLAGGDAWKNGVSRFYKLIRDQDNPAYKVFEPAHGAVRVALMDSGTDMKVYPDLGVFLGSGSRDYGDNDSNPWSPAIGTLAHGSGTLATLLTVVAHEAPEVLRERGLVADMWKVYSNRSVLAGPPFSDGDPWSSRKFSHIDAIIDQVESDGPKPDIVSVSLGFQSAEILKKIGRESLLASSSWLWVMAAGNESRDVTDEDRGCFSDHEGDARPADRILCIGAIRQGIIGDSVTEYTNFGELVDVYAYEAYYPELCPAGTSCSTPAVAAAAAVIKQKFPKLLPEQVKQAIVEAAVEMTLPVAGSGGMSPELTTPVQKVVRVFDPTRQLKRALEIAEKMPKGKIPRWLEQLSDKLYF